ncbi:MAG: type II toxin-antitoxin system HicA family toxin [Proteobacteria bacterium]|nr:type II toxin-antitoxin system HicA family toxin [Pseudomonadota bacterium]
MPPSLPHISGTEVVRALEKLGFTAVRQKGSHVVLRRGSAGCVVPLHRELKIGTLSGVLKQAGVAADEFMCVL